VSSVGDTSVTSSDLIKLLIASWFESKPKENRAEAPSAMRTPTRGWNWPTAAVRALTTRER